MFEKEAEDYALGNIGRNDLLAKAFQDGAEFGYQKGIAVNTDELKTNIKALREKVHWWKKEVNVAHRARAEEFENITIENRALKGKLAEAIDLLNFWIEDFYDGFNHSNSYEVRHNVLVKIEQFIEENK